MSSAFLILNGVRIPCEDVSDSYKASVVRHQYAGHNGADLEFMGMEATDLRVHAVFSGTQEVQVFESLLEVLNNGDLVAVEHGFLGSFNAFITGIEDRWSDDDTSVDVDISLSRDGIDQTTSYKPRAVELRAELMNAAIAEVHADEVKKFAPDSPPDVDIDDDDWLESARSQVRSGLQLFIGKIADAVGTVDGVLAGIDGDLSAAYNALAFVADLPGQVQQRIAKAQDLLAGRCESAPDPVASFRRLCEGLEELYNILSLTPLANAAKVQGAMQASGTAATIIDSEEQKLRQRVAIESADTFDDSGHWLGRTAAKGSNGSSAGTETSMPATAAQIGAVVGQARAMLADAMSYVSDPTPLERMAQALQEQYSARISEMETTLEIDVPQPTPLHVICVKHGLPYNAAERVAALNGLRNPTFVQGRIKIYAAS